MRRLLFAVLLVVCSAGAYGFDTDVGFRMSPVTFSPGLVSEDVNPLANLAFSNPSQREDQNEVLGISTVKSFRMPECDLEDEDACETSTPVVDLKVQVITANLPMILDQSQAGEVMDAGQTVLGSE